MPLYTNDLRNRTVPLKVGLIVGHESLVKYKSRFRIDFVGGNDTVKLTMVIDGNGNPCSISQGEHHYLTLIMTTPATKRWL